MQIEINWANVSDNPEIIGYLKIREYIADLIFKLDKEYNNSSIVKLLSKGKLFGRVEDEEGNKWDTTLIRLTPKEKENESLRNS